MSDIKIVGAVYGAIEGSKDVTTLVQGYVNAKQFSFTASNDVFGDPASRCKKHFGMIYQVNGKKHTVACEEGQNVTIKTT